MNHRQALAAAQLLKLLATPINGREPPDAGMYVALHGDNAHIHPLTLSHQTTSRGEDEEDPDMPCYHTRYLHFAAGWVKMTNTTYILRDSKTRFIRNGHPRVATGVPCEF